MAYLISAFMLLTRLPVRGAPIHPAARAASAWPLVGLVIGGLSVLVLWAATALGLPSGIPAALALTVAIVLTGALHEDGLADVADGFWGGFDRARRLDIMRDSRLGSYGTTALVLSLIARFALLMAAAASAAWLAPIAAAIASRAAMAWMLREPPARTDGLAKGAGIPSGRSIAVATAIAATALLPFGLLGAVAALTAILTTAALARLARAKIGGQTGDVCGAAQQLTEIAILSVLLSG